MATLSLSESQRRDSWSPLKMRSPGPSHRGLVVPARQLVRVRAGPSSECFDYKSYCLSTMPICHPSIHPPTQGPFICLFSCLLIVPSIHTPAYPPTYPSFLPSIYPSILPSFHSTSLVELLIGQVSGQAGRWGRNRTHSLTSRNSQPT